MVKKEIRLRYSGFVIFASKLLSVATGFAFVLMITRSISTEEFGIWGNIDDVFRYFILLSSILPFWITRFVARGHAGSARTGLVANIAMSIVSASIYIALLPIIIHALQVSAGYAILYTIIGIQILELYTISAQEAVLQAKQPQAVGYGLLLYEICKVFLGFLLIVQFKLGMLGAICSMISAYTIQITFYVKLNAKELKESFRWIYLKEWIKASLTNIYYIIGMRIASFTLILLFMYGELARSYYGAALTIANVIGYSTSLAYALYPKLLSQINIRDISTSLKMVLMYAIPMTIGIIVLSDSYLTILKPDFADARFVLSILAISTFCVGLSQVFNTITMGTEKIDVKAQIPFRQLVRTRLFQVFTLPYVKSAITLPTTLFALNYLAKNQLEAVTYLVLIALSVDIAMLLWRYTIAKKCLNFSFPWKNVTKYIIASAAMTTLLLVVPHPTRLSPTIALTILGGIIYFAILAVTDHETRELIKSILNEARSQLGIM